MANFNIMKDGAIAQILTWASAVQVGSNYADTMLLPLQKIVGEMSSNMTVMETGLADMGLPSNANFDQIVKGCRKRSVVSLTFTDGKSRELPDDAGTLVIITGDYARNASPYVSRNSICIWATKTNISIGYFNGLGGDFQWFPIMYSNIDFTIHSDWGNVYFPKAVKQGNRIHFSCLAQRAKVTDGNDILVTFNGYDFGTAGTQVGNIVNAGTGISMYAFTDQATTSIKVQQNDNSAIPVETYIRIDFDFITS